ncbi:MAG: hypothetical protein ABI569_03255 [Casimicrobiaceae bacterium]
MARCLQSEWVAFALAHIDEGAVTSNYMADAEQVCNVVNEALAERVAIESYREIIAWLDGKDSTTRKMLEEILAMEEEHAEDMPSLLAGLRDQADSRLQILPGPAPPPAQ